MAWAARSDRGRPFGRRWSRASRRAWVAASTGSRKGPIDWPQSTWPSIRRPAAGGGRTHWPAVRSAATSEWTGGLASRFDAGPAFSAGYVGVAYSSVAWESQLVDLSDPRGLSTLARRRLYLLLAVSVKELAVYLEGEQPGEPSAQSLLLVGTILALLTFLNEVDGYRQ
jgi:hypothetical protein